ncbi:MAG TPA: hypothetical protein VI915_01740 [Thermoplasmata archaeon]|nr:hypothetical protein [Thermoplasmata archaeon]
MLPFDVDRVRIDVSKHFRNTWMRKWNWDHTDLREAMRDAYDVQREGKAKWEILVRKKGEKKLVVVYEAEADEVLVITGAEG